jgi:predicted nuclease of predicted toxin-antitoxin system
MKFLCDVHISYSLMKTLKSFGFETIHVNQILDKWNTKDRDITNFADQNDYVIISKDADFKTSFLLNQKPKKLVKINLGNISNSHLIEIFNNNIDRIRALNELSTFIIEIDHDLITYFSAEREGFWS